MLDEPVVRQLSERSTRERVRLDAVARRERVEVHALVQAETQDEGVGSVRDRLKRVLGYDVREYIGQSPSEWIDARDSRRETFDVGARCAHHRKPPAGE